jgi:hypothetical protein
MGERLKRAIIHKAIKSGCKLDGALIRYDKRLYYVNIAKDEVMLQLEVK